MSVVLLGMDVPESCNMCYISALKCDLWKEAVSGNRHSDCPFSPLPKSHGRLVDASKLDFLSYNAKKHQKDTFDVGVMYALDLLDKLPTIVNEEWEE